MRGTTPQRPGSALSDRRRSISGHIAARNSIAPGGGGGAGRASIGGSGIPRLQQSRISAVRTANQQPAFDFLTGAETHDPTTRRVPVKRERVPSVDYETDKPLTPPIDERELQELKSEVRSLKYTISTNGQEQELIRVRQEAELREAQGRADKDFETMQHAEAERLKAVRMLESLQREMQEFVNAASDEKASMERRLRHAEEGQRVVEEELEECKAERDDLVRGAERRNADLVGTNAGLKKALDELQEDVNQRINGLREVQEQLQQKDDQIGTLQGEVLHLKAHTGDAEVLAVVQAQLSEQVTHIRTLEMAARDTNRELEHFRAVHKSIQVVEEQKRELERKLDKVEEVEHELREAILQRQRLEDERLAWTAYLKSQEDEHGALEFDTPEAVARALVDARLQNASLVERLGDLEPQLTEKELIIQSLEQDRNRLQTEIATAKTVPSGGDTKAILRLQRQKTLAVKEVEFLKAQLKAMDTEESTMELASFSADKAARISQLEEAVDAYRQEVQALHDELATAEASQPAAAGTKRPREESAEESEVLGQLSRRNRKLQNEYSLLKTRCQSLEKELSVTQQRLSASIAHSSTRILALKANPTCTHDAIKSSTLTSLRTENAALLAQLQSAISSNSSTSSLQTIPAATLRSKELEIDALEAKCKEKDIRMDRMKKVWMRTTGEMRTAIVSTLGWKASFFADGKVSLCSVFYPATEECENAIVFDGEAGSMKVSGGPKSAFAAKIQGNIDYWVKERNEIPCLLAALTLEFYDEGTKAG